MLARSEEQDLELITEELLAEVRGIRRALRTRATIDRAIGVLMKRLACDADEAFATLADISQNTNRKLHLVAGDLTGDRAAGSRADQAGRTPLRLVTIPLRGEIDMSNARGLRRSLASVDDQDAAVVVVDLAEVTFIDCAGLRPLLEARARLGHRLRLRNVPPQIRRMFVFSGTADALLH